MLDFDVTSNDILLLTKHKLFANEVFEMKIKDVCIQTGLTDRAVRFYVEKGLLDTRSNTANGRINREYSAENIEELKDISKLRQAGFSIQDIIEMQNPNVDISDIVFKHCTKLEEEQRVNENIIKELKNIYKRGNISWRKAASLLGRHNDEYVYTPRFAQFDESLVEEDSKKSIHKLKIYFSFLFISAFIVLFALAAVQKQYNEQPLVSVIAISEVTFLDKWIDNGMYVEISTNPDAAIGYDNYFFESKKLMLESEDYYDAILLSDTPYESASIRIEIPYKEAKEHELLDSKQNIIIEKVLDNDDYIEAYCTVISIS